MVLRTADINDTLDVMNGNKVLNEISHSILVVDVYIGNALERHADTYDRKALLLGCPAATLS